MKQQFLRSWRQLFYNFNKGEEMRTVRILFVLLGLLLAGFASQSLRAQDCESIPYSNDQVGMQSMAGMPGDTVWANIWTITDSIVLGFQMLIRFDSTILKPLPSPVGNGRIVVEATGRFTDSEDLIAQVSEVEEDSGAILISFLPGPLQPLDSIPPGRGVILKVPFVVQPAAYYVEHSWLRFIRYSASVIDTTNSPPDTVITCRGTRFAVVAPEPQGAKDVFPRPSIGYFHAYPFGGEIPIVDRFTISPRSVWQGDSASALWQVRYSDSVVITPAIGMHPGSYQTEPFVVAESSPTSYTLTAFGNDTSVSETTRLLAVPSGANRYPYWVYPPEPGVGYVLAPMSLFFYAEDPDGHQPTYSSPNLPPGATITAEPGFGMRFFWTPGATDTGYHEISFLTHDSLDPALYDSINCIIYVNDENIPPTGSYDNSPRDISEGDTLIIVVTASDPNGTIPAIEADIPYDSLTSNFSFVDSGNGVGVLTLIPDYFDGNTNPAEYYLRFRVRDEADPALVTYTASTPVRVYNRNQGLEMPVLTMSTEGPFEILEHDTLILDLTATTSTGDLPVISADSLPATATLSYPQGTNRKDQARLRFKPVDGQAGDYRFIFFAANLDLVDSVAADITVLPRNHPPIIYVPPASILIYEEDTAQLFVLALDPDSTTPVISAFLDGSDTLAPNMTLVDSGNGAAVLTFVPNRIQGSACGTVYYYVRFRATDVLPPYPSVVSPPQTIRVLDSGLPCCLGIRGDVNYDGNGHGHPDISDLTRLITYLFRSGEPLPCRLEADFDNSGNINVADPVLLIDYLFQRGLPLSECAPTRTVGDTGPACEE